MQNSVLAGLPDCSGQYTNATRDRRWMPLNPAQNLTQRDDPWSDVELATGIPDGNS